MIMFSAGSVPSIFCKCSLSGDCLTLRFLKKDCEINIFSKLSHYFKKIFFLNQPYRKFSKISRTVKTTHYKYLQVTLNWVHCPITEIIKRDEISYICMMDSV